MRVIWRVLFVIPLGFIAACLAAGIFIAVAAYGTGALDRDTVIWPAIFGVLAAPVIGGLAALPALAVIVLAELLSWRSVLAYLVVGGVAGLSAYLLADNTAAAISDTDAQLSMTAGIVGGLAYWLVAGRTAGGYRRDRMSA
jgi:hypothetical protein